MVIITIHQAIRIHQEFLVLLCPELLVFSSCMLFFGQLSYLKFHLKLWHFSHWRLPSQTCQHVQISFKSSVVFKGSEAILNHLHKIVTIFLVIYSIIYICVCVLFLSAIYHDHYIYIYYYYQTRKKQTHVFCENHCPCGTDLFTEERNSLKPWFFPAPKRPSFSSFPTTSWCGNWTENSGPFSALAAGPGRPWPRC